MINQNIYKRFVPGTVSPAVYDKNAFWFVFSGNRLLLAFTESQPSLPFITHPTQLNLHPIRIQFLGCLDESPCYSAEVDMDAAAPEGMRFSELRSTYDLIEEDLFLLAGRAYQIVTWDQTHQYCGKCGAATHTHKSERAKVCSQCGMISYPRISPATIVAILKDKQILLAHNKSFRGNMYSLIAGFAEPGENLEACVKREVFEEVGIKIKNVKYFGSQPWPFPNSLMVGFTAEYDSGEISVDGEEIIDAGWYDKENLPELPSPMSIARKIINWVIETRM